jgi:hypothetical protein
VRHRRAVGVAQRSARDLRRHDAHREVGVGGERAHLRERVGVVGVDQTAKGAARRAVLDGGVALRQRGGLECVALGFGQHGLGKEVGRRQHEQVVADQEARVVVAQRRIAWRRVEERTHHRRAGLVRAAEQRVELGQQAVAARDRHAARRLALGAKRPRLVRRGAVGRVRARQRQHAADRHPARVQLGVRVAEKEAANVGPAERLAAEAELQHHRNREAKVARVAAVVAGPRRRVALRADAAGARQQKRPLVGRAASRPLRVASAISMP